MACSTMQLRFFFKLGTVVTDAFKYLFYIIVYPFYMNDNLLQIE